jgi:hypothetical protein
MASRLERLYEEHVAAPTREHAELLRVFQELELEWIQEYLPLALTKLGLSDLADEIQIVTSDQAAWDALLSVEQGDWRGAHEAYRQLDVHVELPLDGWHVLRFEESPDDIRISQVSLVRGPEAVVTYPLYLVGNKVRELERVWGGRIEPGKRLDKSEEHWLPLRLRAKLLAAGVQAGPAIEVLGALQDEWDLAEADRYQAAEDLWLEEWSEKLVKGLPEVAEILDVDPHDFIVEAPDWNGSGRQFPRARLILDDGVDLVVAINSIGFDCRLAVEGEQEQQLFELQRDRRKGIWGRVRGEEAGLIPNAEMMHLGRKQANRERISVIQVRRLYLEQAQKALEHRLDSAPALSALDSPPVALPVAEPERLSLGL